MAVRVDPPCLVTRGLILTLTARRVKMESVALLAQMYASPGCSEATMVGVNSLRAICDF